jgi:hypothetical protein
MLKINKGKIVRPKKVVIYAGEGVGKTTLASKFPDPLFIDTENGTYNLDVSRVNKPDSWDELLTIVKEVSMQDVCKTLVIDTVDWAEMLAISSVCEKHRVTSIEQISYGKGYTYVADRFIELFKELDKVIESGKHVVLTAHSKTRKFELPEEQGQYDRYEMKLTRQVAPLIKEWSDLLLFGNYKTFVVTTENNTRKAQGGKRVMYTTHNPCWDAKNRDELPNELDLSFSEIEHLFTEQDFTKPEIPFPDPKDTTSVSIVAKLEKMIEDSKITDLDIQKVVAAKGHYELETPISDYSDDFITRWIIPNWKKIVETIKNEKGEQ